METPEQIEKARVEIERERLELDKSKAGFDRSFFRANSAVLISAAVSLAALIVSLGQVWVTKISKDKELEVATLQKKLELDVQDKQKTRELALLDEQKKRDWDISAARFVTDNRKAIFHGNLQEQRLFAQVIGTIYPPEISKDFLSRIETASPAASRQTWHEVRNAIETGAPVSASLSVQASDTLSKTNATHKLQAIVATLEKDKDVGPVLKAANISSQDIDREKLKSALIGIRRNAALTNNQELLKKVNQAIVEVGR